MVKRLADVTDNLDVLVNNVSAMPDFRSCSMLDVDFESLHSIFEVNVSGSWALTQELLPLSKRAPAARIVNVTSTAAQQVAVPQPGPLFAPAYSFAKYTLNALTRTLAAALADTPGSVASHPERGDDEKDRSPAEPRRYRLGGDAWSGWAEWRSLLRR